MAPGYMVVADALVGAGVTDVFGVMGEGNLELVTHLHSEPGVRYHAARHEAGAVAAAHGYAQASGRLGVATVTHGPGFTNGITALVSAVGVRAPTLLVVGDTAPDAPGHVQRTDHGAWTRAAGAVFEEARSFAALPFAVDRAIHRAVHEWKTVVLLVPVDVLEGEAAPAARSPRPVPVLRGQASDEAVARAIAAIESANRPVVLAGLGAVRAGAAAALTRLAELIGAELATTLRARGFFDGHPLSVGMVGGYGHELATEPCAEADLLLAFGASLNVFTMSAGRSFAGATVVQCDIDATAFGAATRVDVPLVGDAVTVAEQLLSAMDGRELPETADRRSAREARVAAWAPAPVPETGPPFHPAAVCRAFDAALPDDRTVVVDAGAFTEYPLKWFGAPDPTGLVFTQGFGSVGLGLGAALGASAAKPDRPCVVFVGDGGFMMSLPQFESAVRFGCPIVTIVMDDGAYGAEIHHLRRRGRPMDAARFANPDFAAVARSLGADGVRLERLDDAAEIGARVAGGLERPLLVHVEIDGDVVSPWFSGLVEHATRFLGLPRRPSG